MARKLKPSEDPDLFEWSPNEESIPEADILESFRRRGVKPATIDDLKFRKKYIDYVAGYKPE